MTPIEPPASLVRRIERADRFLLSGHMNPDGDSIGSALGLASLLNALGKSCVIWNRDQTPAIYRALPGANSIRTGTTPPATDLADDFDVFVALECPSLDRTGLEPHLIDLPTINMDHHLGNVEYGVENWVDAEAPALGEMVLTLSEALGVSLEPDAATALLVALSSDTGGFRFANATPRAFESAARLVRAGADPTLVAKWLHESQPEQTIRLLAEMLLSLQLTAEGKVASVLLESSMFARAGASTAHSEGLINHPRAIAGVEAVALVRELDANECKVSLRSRGAIDVESIARRHDGGGHRNAAGYVAVGHPDEVRRKAVAELAREIKKHEV